MNISKARRKQSLRKFRHQSEKFFSRLFSTWLSPVGAAFTVGILWVGILGVTWQEYANWGEQSKGIYIEAWGTALDIFLVAGILTLFSRFDERRGQIERYLEEIDDFKKWDGREAQLRIAGNIRRLNKLGKTNIDFSGIVLRDFAFGDSDIDSLKGSTFSQGFRLDKPSKNQTKLENVNFVGVDCSSVVFSSGWPFGLTASNLDFYGSKLEGARFDGATLRWTSDRKNETDWDVQDGESDDGSPILIPVYRPQFFEVSLRGCSFRKVQFDKADFRRADNILEADFTDARGLQTCLFDDDVRDQVLKAARKGRGSDAERQTEPAPR